MSDELALGPQGWAVPNDDIRVIDTSIFIPDYFCFNLTNGGEIRISLKDGSVTFKDCTPDEGAAHFWKCITNAYPQIAQAILNHNSKPQNSNEFC